MAKHFFMPLIFSASIFTFIYGIPANLKQCKIGKDRNRLVADYNGDGKKETIIYKMDYEDPMCYANISFSDKKIEPLLDTGIFVSYIRKEGNLDSYPGEEFSIYWGSCEAGEWLGGVVYSIRNGKWKTLASFSVYGDPSTYDYVKKDPIDEKAFIVTENYWKGDSMARADRKIYPE